MSIYRPDATADDNAEYYKTPLEQRDTRGLLGDLSSLFRAHAPAQSQRLAILFVYADDRLADYYRHIRDFSESVLREKALPPDQAAQAQAIVGILDDRFPGIAPANAR